MYRSCLVLSALGVLASAVLPPGYEDELYCPDGHCLKRIRVGQVGPRSKLHICVGRGPNALGPTPPVPWGSKVGEEKKSELLAQGLVKAELCVVTLMRAEEDRLAAEALGYAGRAREAAGRAAGGGSDGGGGGDGDSAVGGGGGGGGDAGDAPLSPEAIAADEAEVAAVKAKLKEGIGLLKQGLQKAAQEAGASAAPHPLGASADDPKSVQDAMEIMFSNMVDAMGNAVDPGGAKRRRDEQHHARRYVRLGITAAGAAFGAWLLWRLASALLGGIMPTKHVREANDVLAGLRKRQEAKSA
jgi:hypothetical protein